MPQRCLAWDSERRSLFLSSVFSLSKIDLLDDDIEDLDLKDFGDGEDILDDVPLDDDLGGLPRGSLPLGDISTICAPGLGPQLTRAPGGGRSPRGKVAPGLALTIPHEDPSDPGVPERGCDVP